MLNDAEGEDVEYVRGLLHLYREQNQEAAKSLESYLENHPDHAYVHYYAGLAYNLTERKSPVQKI